MGERAGSRLRPWSAATVVLGVFGPLGAHLELLAPMAGFRLFLGALALSLVTVVAGVIGLARAGAGRRRRVLLWMSPALAVWIPVVVVLARHAGAPPIHDITTDTAHPPEFVRARSLPENAGRDLQYPGEACARRQRAAYPDIAPLRLEEEPDRAWERVRRVAAGMPGWRLTREDPRQRALEGYEASWLFRFRDDFVIEVRSRAGGSEVHMRSRSRDGRGDLGANAARIRRFFAALASR